ncbi:MAG: hypothetical protein LWX07_02860 [Bacteroidetes bacterium]|nr:hypothetical protein [Bacteroidota bacterium]
MINKLLFSVCSTFSETDWDDFKIFVGSRDSVSPRKYLPFVSVLSEYKSDFNGVKNIPAETLFFAAYKKNYSGQTVLNRQTELLALTKEYLENSAYRKNIQVRKNLYAQELLSRNLLDLFLKEKRSGDGYGDFTYSEDDYDFAQQSILFYGAYHQMRKQIPESQEKYFQHSRFLMADLLCKLYRTGQELQIQKYFSLNHGFNPVLEFIGSLRQEEFFENKDIRKDDLFTVPLLRYYLFMAFRHPDNQRYITKALKKFFSKENNFSEYFRTEMYRMFMTYYIVKVNNGESRYYGDLYRLYDRKLKNNLVSDLQRCSYPASVFREYIIAGLKVKKYKWTENIIIKYAPLLPETVRADEVNLAAIRLGFAKRAFEKVIGLVQEHKSRNNTHHLDSMRYKLASLYELGEFEEAYYEIDRAKHFLKYNKNSLPEIQVTYQKKFIDRVLKLLNYHANPYNKDPEMILHSIENDKDRYTMRDWVTEKARALATRRPSKK